VLHCHGKEVGFNHTEKVSKRFITLQSCLHAYYFHLVPILLSILMFKD